MSYVRNKPKSKEASPQQHPQKASRRSGLEECLKLLQEGWEYVQYFDCYGMKFLREPREWADGVRTLKLIEVGLDIPLKEAGHTLILDNRKL